MMSSGAPLPSPIGVLMKDLPGPSGKPVCPICLITRKMPVVECCISQGYEGLALVLSHRLSLLAIKMYFSCTSEAHL